MSVVGAASLLVAATTDSGPGGVWAEGILVQGGIVAPHLVLVEATNILPLLERAKELSPLEATAAQRDLVRLAIDLLPFEPFAEGVWGLGRTVQSSEGW